MTSPMTLGNMRANGVGTRSTDHMLTLKRASKHRAGGWGGNGKFGFRVTPTDTLHRSGLHQKARQGLGGP
jgi:hypothetical protein